MIACLLGIQLCGFQFSGSQLHAANMPGKPTGNERIFLHHKGAVSLFAADKLNNSTLWRTGKRQERHTLPLATMDGDAQIRGKERQGIGH